MNYKPSEFLPLYVYKLYTIYYYYNREKKKRKEEEKENCGGL